MAAQIAAVDVAADPFASAGRSAPIASGSALRGGRLGNDEAFDAVRNVDLLPAGVPSAKPGWLLPVIVGVLALVVGGAVTLVVMGR
jgi:hypothetical protein